MSQSTDLATKPDAPVQTTVRDVLEAMQQNRIDKAPVPIVNGRLVPGDFDGAWRVATWLAATGKLPSGCKNAADAMLVVLAGSEKGLGLIASLTNMMVVNNRPTMWGDAVLGLCMATGQVEQFKETVTGKPPNMTATCTVKRKGFDPITYSWTWDQALKAGLTGKDPYVKFPERMIRMRPRAWALRDAFPDILMGIGVTEEALDAPPMATEKADNLGAAIEALPEATPAPSTTPPPTAGSVGTEPQYEFTDSQ